METAVESTTEMSLKLRQKQEALSRLMRLKVPSNVAKDFDRFGRVYMCSSPSGNYALIDDKDMKAEITAFEESYEATVFLVIRMVTFYGLLDSFIYVSKYTDEWDEEKTDLKDGYLMTYTINRDYPMCTEFGSICIEHTDNRGVIRVG